MSELETLFAWHINRLGCPEPVREFRFHPKRRWKFDFCWPEAMVAVEVEGGIWSGGRHTSGKGFQNDCEKYAEALLLGWRVLRVTGDQVKSGKAGEWTVKLLGATK